MTTRSRLWALATMGLVACGNEVTGAAADFRYARATNSCAPTDAPAVNIVLAVKPFSGVPVGQPYFDINLWTGLDDLTGRPYRLVQNSNDGFASYNSARDRRAGMVTGTVVVTGVTSDLSVHGTLDLRLSDGTRFLRDFVAPWRPTRALCG
jgi:hypothetical protein